jgi:Secretion system C-terminal sorting domain
MKKLLVIIIAVGVTANMLAQSNPCYIKYTYDASGNRIKREFICAPADSIVAGGGDSKRLANTINIAPISSNFDFSITPNPANNQIVITLSNSTAINKASIFNNLGQEVINFTITSALQPIDVSSLSAGMYYAVLQSDTKKMIKKFVKVD